MNKFLLALFTIFFFTNSVFSAPVLKSISKTGTIPDAILPREMTALEIRAIQTKEFQTTNKILVMKAMLDVFQDCGYIIETANPILGFISGNKDYQNANGQITSFQLTANITKKSKTTKVRINIKQINRNIYGAAETVINVFDGSAYQSFYSQIDKAIYEQKSVYNK